LGLGVTIGGALHAIDSPQAQQRKAIAQMSAGYAAEEMAEF